MDAATLFNCCTDHAEPDWLQFTDLEIGGCITIRENAEEWTEGGQTRADAEFFTVYGRLKDGGCEAITDCPTFESALAAANALCDLSSLRCHIYC